MANKAIEYYKTCPVGVYHDFKVELLVSDENGQVETCRHCHVKKIYKFRPDGQLVENEQYFRDHIRAFAQPGMPVYNDIFPDFEAKLEQEAKRKKVSEMYQGNLSDRFKFEIKKILK